MGAPIRCSDRKLRKKNGKYSKWKARLEMMKDNEAYQGHSAGSKNNQLVDIIKEVICFSFVEEIL